MLRLPQGQICEVWESSKNQYSFVNREIVDKNVLPVVTFRELYIYIKFLISLYHCKENFFFLSNAPHVLYGLRGLPSCAWQKSNRLLRLGRP